MRLALICFPLLAVALACDAAPKKRRNAADTTQPIDRACTVRECFLEREVRDFEVIDQTTVIVYVGSQRCPFQLEVHGTFCDLTFAPELYFHSPTELARNDDRDIISGTSRSGQLGDLRICRNDLSIGVDGGVFTESPDVSPNTDRYGNRRSDCQISNIMSMTDDEIVELYVKHGVAPPPPPMGSGQIEVGDQKDEAESPSTEKQPAASNADGAGAEATAATTAN